MPFPAPAGHSADKNQSSGSPVQSRLIRKHSLDFLEILLQRRIRDDYSEKPVSLLIVHLRAYRQRSVGRRVRLTALFVEQSPNRLFEHFHIN